MDWKKIIASWFKPPKTIFEKGSGCIIFIIASIIGLCLLAKLYQMLFL